MNMQSLMAQAQKMQRDITKKKEELNKKEFVSKNGIVTITMNGNKELVKIEIDKSKDMNSDDLEMLEDMIFIAHKNVIADIDKETEKAMGQYGGALSGLM